MVPRRRACTSLPTDWKEASGLLGKVTDGGADNAAAIGDQLTGPAAVCWYAKSTLVAPVFVARVKQQDAAGIAALKTALGKTFGNVIGAYEAKAAKADGAESGYRRLPVTVRDQGADVTVWQRPVSARSGTAVSSKASFASQLSAERYFPVDETDFTAVIDTIIAARPDFVFSTLIGMVPLWMAVCSAVP